MVNPRFEHNSQKPIPTSKSLPTRLTFRVRTAKKPMIWRCSVPESRESNNKPKSHSKPEEQRQAIFSALLGAAKAKHRTRLERQDTLADGSVRYIKCEREDLATV